MLTRRSLPSSPRAVAALVLLALTLPSPSLSVALANGRPPGTTGILVAPQSPTHKPERTLLLGATFGLAVSNDSGRHFRWICEEAIGGPTGVDALLAAPSSDVLLTGSTMGLFISRDGGCDWQSVDLFAPPRQVSAIATDPHNPGRWYVAVNVPEQNRGLVYATYDNGKTYQKLSVDHDGVYLYGMAVSPQAPQKLAVVGSNNGAHDSCLLLTSSNGGSTWHKRAVAHAPDASATPSVAISPKNANVLLVTALDITTNGSHALISHDFGQSFRALGPLKEPVRNIAFAPDGQQAFIATTGHIFCATVKGGSLAELPSPKSNACAAVDGNTLLACGSSANGQDGFALAKSTDGGQTFAPIIGLSDIGGPEGCPAHSSSQTKCAALWPNQLAAIKASASFDAASEFIASEQTPGAATPPMAAPPTPQPRKTSGCSCTIGGAGFGADGALFAAPALAYMVRRALRRRPTGHQSPKIL